MNESPENYKTPSQRLFENVIKDNDEFISDLEGAEDLSALRKVLESHTRVDPCGDHYFYHITDAGTEDVDIHPHFVFEFDELLAEFEKDAPTEAEEIDMKIPHPELNKAVKRVLGIAE